MAEGIGASVRRRRIEAGILQARLADVVGISASHLSRFERGRRDVSLRTLDAIVRALVELGGIPIPEPAGADPCPSTTESPDVGGGSSVFWGADPGIDGV